MPEPLPIPPDVMEELAALRVEVPQAELEQLADYLARLLDANTRMNLTAIRDPEQAWRRLILDSLTPLPGLHDLPEGSSLIDVGTGGGLPGIPLAITRPDLRVTLLDATGKKVDFLDAVIRDMGLANCRAFKGRAETLAHNSFHRARLRRGRVSRDGAAERGARVLPPLREGGRPPARDEGAQAWRRRWNRRAMH